MYEEDEDFDYMFVTLVQSFHCLYDTTMEQFYREDAQDRAWAEIARDIGDGITPEECKKRWTKLRESFIESLNVSGSEQDYYQHLLQFLTPFIGTTANSVILNGEPLEESDGRYVYNCKLIKAVERFPCLYDPSLKGNQTFIDEKWREVAQIVGDGSTAMKCRKKWINIRNAFILRKKFKRGGYYLSKVLQFLEPSLTLYNIDENAPELSGTGNHQSTEILPHVDNQQAPKRTYDEMFDSAVVQSCEVANNSKASKKAKFIKVIESFPCLYDGTMHPKSLIIRSAWKEVARLVGNGVSAKQCMNRWRSFRQAYVRSRRLKYSYYLGDSIRFLDPFITINETIKDTNEDECELVMRDQTDSAAAVPTVAKACDSVCTAVDMSDYD